MSNVYHGQWEAYTPEKPPKGAPPHALFARRLNDRVDWYDYVKSGQHFRSDSVKFAIAWRGDDQGWVVGPATRDETAIFPAGHAVYEILTYNGNDPQGYFGNKRYDTKTGVFSDPPSSTLARPNEDLANALQELLARVEALENK
jgi:hypothetical protein